MNFICNHYENYEFVCLSSGLPNELEIYWHQYPYPFSEGFCKLRSFISERWEKTLKSSDTSFIQTKVLFLHFMHEVKVFIFSRLIYFHVVNILSSSSSYAAVLTILSFSLERYLVICHPMQLSILPLTDLTRSALVITFCWIVSMGASVPYYIFTRLDICHIFNNF